MHPLARIAVLGAVLSLASSAMAQESPMHRPVQDGQLWISGGFELRFDKEAQKRIKKAKEGRETGKLTGAELERAEKRAAEAGRSFKSRFRITGEVDHRRSENMTRSNLFYTVLGVRYRFHEYARLTLEHRYNIRPSGRNTHRINVQADTDRNFGRFNAGYRLAYQHEFTTPDKYRDIVRNRLQLSFRSKRFPVDPYISAESFTAFHHTGNQLIGMRYGIGAEWKLSKDHVLDLSVRHHREHGQPGLKYRWIFNVGYEFKWRR
ncbi:MAG TPA: DUF2490 domain-containing protein [Flavobacteriales bacterium]|nr:DUF2490 domain-containing protein [Flavobacteriales bacterium]